MCEVHVSAGLGTQQSYSGFGFAAPNKSAWCVMIIPKSIMIFTANPLFGSFPAMPAAPKRLEESKTKAELQYDSEENPNVSR